MKCSFFVQAHRHRLGGAVNPEALDGRRDDPLGEDRRRPSHLGLLVEDLQSGHQRPVGVVAEPAHPGPDPPHHLLARLGVDPPGAGGSEAVERAVHPPVGAVGLGQLRLQAGQLRLVRAGHLGGQDGARRIPQPHQAPKLRRLRRVARPVRTQLAYLQTGQAAAGDDETALLGEAQPHLVVRWMDERGWSQGRRRRRWRVAKAMGSGVGHQAVECPRQRRRQGSGGLDGQLSIPVHAPVDRQRAQHEARVGGEVLVDEQLLGVAVYRCRHRGRPARPGGLGAVGATTQDHQVADHVGARGLGEGSGREAHGADQVGQRLHLPAGGRVAGVEGVARGEHRHQPAGAGEVKALDDEVVVQAEPGPVVAGVVRGDLGEGDVADDQVEAALGRREGLEAALVDLGPCSVEVAGHGCGGAVGLHADELAALGGEAEKVARPAPRLQHPASAEAEPPHQLPDGGDNLGGGVVGVQGRPPGLRPGVVVAQEAPGGGPVAGVAVVGLVEDLGQAAPARPPGQHGLFVGCRRPALVAEAVEDLEDGEVGGQLGCLARRGQVGLADRPEGYGRGGASVCRSVQVRSREARVREVVASQER